MGSGNAGTTNVMRSAGFLPGALTFIFDALKGFAAVYIGKMIFDSVHSVTNTAWSEPVYGAYLCGVACMLGHVFPIFFQFKGGKGVATTAAMILTLDPLCFVFLLIVFVVIVASTKYVSLGSVISCMIYPVLTYKIAYAGISGWGIGFPVIFSFLTAATVVFMHRENISRLRKGTENKISFSKTSKEKK